MKKLAPLPKTSKHTPGFWTHSVLGGDRYILSGSGHVIAKVGGDLLAYQKQQPANAALIAKSPDMAQALENVMAFRHAVSYALESRPETAKDWDALCAKINSILLAAEVR